MWPWGHLAVGYLVYSLVTHLRDGHPPRDYPTLALAVGTQFPDLVDKPLAWTVGILVSGRSLAHSLITVCLVVLGLHLLVRHRHYRRLVAAFSIGYLSHSGADAVGTIVADDYAALRFLVWPVVPAREPNTDMSILAHFQSIELTSFFAVQLVLVGLAVGVWVYDGTPGWTALKRLPAVIVRTLSA